MPVPQYGSVIKANTDNNYRYNHEKDFGLFPILPKYTFWLSWMNFWIPLFPILLLMWGVTRFRTSSNPNCLLSGTVSLF